LVRTRERYIVKIVFRFYKSRNNLYSKGIAEYFIKDSNIGITKDIIGLRA